MPQTTSQTSSKSQAESYGSGELKPKQMQLTEQEQMDLGMEVDHPMSEYPWEPEAPVERALLSPEELEQTVMEEEALEESRSEPRETRETWQPETTQEMSEPDDFLDTI